MECISCNKEAVYVLEGNSYCRKHRKEKEKSIELAEKLTKQITNNLVRSNRLIFFK